MSKHLFTLLLLLNICRLNAQKNEWTALADCGNYINVLKSVTDPQGNVYVAGRFQGETRFQSAKTKDSVARKFSSSYSRVNFLACYSPMGNLKFVHKFEGSEIFELRSMCCMMNNSVLLIFYGTGKMDQGPGNKFQPYKYEGNGNVFRVSSSGKLLMTAQITNVNGLISTTDPSGNVYLSSQAANSWEKNKIFRFDSLMKPKGEINIENSIPKALKFDGNKLFVLIQNTPDYGNLFESGNYKEPAHAVVPKDCIGLCVADFASASLSLKNSWHVPTYTPWEKKAALHYYPSMNYFDGKMYADLFIYCHQLHYQFAGEDLKTGQKDNSRIYRLCEDGSILKSDFFNGGYYNQNVFPGKNGSLYLVFTATDTFKISDSKKVIPRKYSAFVNELIFAKMDKNLKWEWVSEGGSTASNYHQSFLLESEKGDIYGVSDLLNYAKFGNDSIAPKWNSAYYVTRISSSSAKTK